MDFTSLFDQFYPPLFRYCYRLTGDRDQAEDVSQEAFVRLYERKVEGEPPALRVWLFKVATHLVRDQVKTRDNRLRLLTRNPVRPGELPAPDREAERAETVAAVWQALDALDPRDRQLLLMKEEGFRYQEIADAVGVAPGSVGTLLARAQQRFEKTYLTQREAHESSG